MKRFEISYNPYSNRIHFRVAIPVDEESVTDWRELPPESSFVEYQNNECIFENNAERILELINQYINTTEFLEIVFKGTEEDFNILQNKLNSCSDPRAKRITCTHAEIYISSKVALERLKKSFSKIEHEFDDYFGSDEADKKEIGDAIANYIETVSPEIQVCVIGPNGVGKSALINAFIGREVLPSQAFSTTRINTIVRNDNEYRIEFNYLQELYVIKIVGSEYIVCKPDKPKSKIVSLLFSGCDACTNEQELLNFALDRINNLLEKDEFIKRINRCIAVFVPFNSSKLNADNNTFCFIDSPVSFNDDEENPIISLEELVSNQTNALAIIVVTRETLNADESLDLKKLIDDLGDGFTKPSSIIAVSMSDELNIQQLKEEIPDSIREGVANPTILFVSPIVALGVKKDDSARWINEDYQQIFERNTNAILKTTPPNCNSISSDKKSIQIERGKKGRLLYASGVPFLEEEMDYYAKRFADYKKCTQGHKFLLDAIDKLVVDLKLSRALSDNELRINRVTRAKEQAAFRKDLIEIINQIERPVVNDAAIPIRTQFSSVLGSYCSSVPDVVRNYWGNVHVRPYTAENLVKDMQQHCQENLYDKNTNDIRIALQGKIKELSLVYLDKIKSIIAERQAFLSLKTKLELKDLFDNKSYRLQLNDVDIKPFNVVGFNVFKRLGSNERTISNYTNEFVNHLMGTNNQLGMFDRQCIAEPSNEYINQLNQWIDGFIAEIKNALNYDTAVLNRFDNRIAELEEEIRIFDKRINDLSEVKTPLLDLIPEDECS